MVDVMRGVPSKKIFYIYWESWVVERHAFGTVTEHCVLTLVYKIETRAFRNKNNHSDY